jgi:regulator of protease activity HflC (stomatin/prohibitin superfamily)
VKLFHVLCVMLAFSMTGCYQFIDSGNVGVKVNASGKNKGISPDFIGVGRAWYNPLTEQIHEFPVYEQNVLWTRNGETDESLTISSSKSAQINVDIGLTYEITDEMVPVLFDKLRKDISYISHHWMRNHVREVLNREASKVDTMAILGEGKEKLLDDAKLKLNATLKEYGIVVKMLSFASAPRPEAKIQASIDATITAQQLAIQAENKVQQSKAEAQQKVEESKGRAESTILEAKANLEQTKLRAEGNKILSASVTPELIDYNKVLKWNGELPRFTGSGTPLINLDVK